MMKPEIKRKSQNILKIESIDNPLVKEISKLKDKKNRNINQLFIVARMFCNTPPLLQKVN